MPFNLGGLEAALISKLLELKVQKFRNQIGLEVENTEAGGGEKKILPCTSLEGVQKIGQHHPLWAGQCFDFKGTSPRMAVKILPALPPLDGAMLAVFAGICPRMAVKNLPALPPLDGAVLAVFAGTCPRMAVKNLPALPPLEGAMLASCGTNLVL